MMYTWSDIMSWLREWFDSIMPVFRVEVFDGVTFLGLIAAVFVIMLTVSIITWFVSNTHGSLGPGGYVEGVITSNRTSRQKTTARVFRNRGRDRKR